MLLSKLLYLLLQINYYGRIFAFKECNDCKQYLSCEGARILALTQPTPETSEVFRNSFCGSEYIDGRNVSKVCCSDFSDPKLVLPPKRCGVAGGINNKGGRMAALYEFPWMTLISYKTPNGLEFNCAGSIINSLYILTAAHCVHRQKVIGVRVGELDIRYKTDCQGEYPNYICESHIQDILVEELIVHEDYNAASSPSQNDIALLRLKKRIDFNYRNVGPICLPITSNLSSASLSGKRGIVAGWGATEINNESPMLLKVDIPILSDNDCRNKYNIHILPEGKNKMEKKICAGEMGKDSCRGDSGAPLVIENEYDGDYSYVQFGIVSEGPSNCGSYRPGIYTDVTKYMDWILEKIKQ